MRYVDEFRDRKLVARVAAEIRKEADPSRTYRFMEVCGTHTMSIFRYGLRDLLPPAIVLISGPGCPVCVTPAGYFDKAIWLARRPGITVAAFGDLFRVPGSRSSLEAARARGASVAMVYSTLDALALARRHPGRQVVFLGVGFETTIPTVAQAVIQAGREGLRNFSVLCGHKTMPAVLASLAASREVAVDGFLLPGHVSAVTGSRPYGFLAKRYGKRCVIAGFEPLDILQAILMLIRQERPAVEIQYTRIIDSCGNPLARKAIARVFQPSAAEWRGIGRVEESGLVIRKAYTFFDAESRFRPRPPAAREPRGCLCGAVLKGVKLPPDCPLFGKRCVPGHPVGACMVSTEGTCAAWFKYRFGTRSHHAVSSGKKRNS